MSELSVKSQLLKKNPENQQPKPFLLLNKETKFFHHKSFVILGLFFFHGQLGTPS